MKMFCSKASLFTLLLVLCVTGIQSPAQGASDCEQVIASEAQLAATFNCDVFCMPIDPPTFQAWLIDPQFFWTDFACLPQEFSAAFAESKEQIQGLTVLKLRLTRSILSGETLVKFPSSTKGVTLAAPPSYQANQQDSATQSALKVWKQYIEWGVLDEKTEPTLSLTMTLADVNDRKAYEADLLATESQDAIASLMEAAQEATFGDSLLLFSQDGIPCGASKFNRLLVQGTNFFLEWFSVTNATYEIAAKTDLLSSNWVALASLYPAALGTNLTSFVDVGGATNVAKFYMVAKTGITILMCDSNTYSGVIPIQVEVGMPGSQELLGIHFSLDGQGATSIVNPRFPFGFEPSGLWDTTLASNGWHQVQAVASYSCSSPSAYCYYRSQIVNVQVFNSVSFPDMPPSFGASLPIQVSLAITNANWTVTVVSPSQQVLSVLTGTTANASISTTWNGNDTNGVPFAGDFVRVQVTATPQGLGPLAGGSGSSGSTVSYRERPWPNPSQGFFVCRQPLFPDVDLWWSTMFNQLVAAVEDAPQYYLIGSGGNSYDIDETPAGWIAWRNILKNGNSTDRPANLFYFGHGSPDALGLNPKQGLGVFSDTIQALLVNGVVTGATNFFRPYRFVFLDGCETANGEWPIAFGIERKKVTTSNYEARGLLPRAFVGWEDTKVISPFKSGGHFLKAHADFVLTWLNSWKNQEKTLKQSIQDGVTAAGSGFSAPVIYGDENLKWNHE